jgi:hypothetical protein
LNISSLSNKDVFIGSIFYSFEAVLGGAIYTNGNVSIRNCQFANNTAENSGGNDVYVSISSTYYNDSGNIENTCSLSLSPGQLKTSSVCVFISFFILNCNFI